MVGHAPCASTTPGSVGSPAPPGTQPQGLPTSTNASIDASAYCGRTASSISASFSGDNQCQVVQVLHVRNFLCSEEPTVEQHRGGRWGSVGGRPSGRFAPLRAIGEVERPRRPFVLFGIQRVSARKLSSYTMNVLAFKEEERCNRTMRGHVTQVNDRIAASKAMGFLYVRALTRFDEGTRPTASAYLVVVPRTGTRRFPRTLMSSRGSRILRPYTECTPFWLVQRGDRRTPSLHRDPPLRCCRDKMDS